MSMFHVGQKVKLMWENTPYNAEGFLKIGVVKSVPSHDTQFYGIADVNPNEPDKVYQFFAHELIELIGPTLNGDTL